MGRSGFRIGLEPVAGAVCAGAHEIEASVLEFLLESWEIMVGSTWYDLARDWVSMGSDSLLTVEVWDVLPPLQVRFLFYDSVEWPMELAAHWLDLALATRRCWLDRRLQQLGYRLDLSTIPSVRPFYEPLARPFAARGGEIEQLSTPGPCACPACRWLDLYHLHRSAQPAPGWQLELVDAHSLGDDGQIDLSFDAGELVLGLSSHGLPRFAWLRGPPEGPWRWLKGDPPAAAPEPGPPEERGYALPVPLTFLREHVDEERGIIVLTGLEDSGEAAVLSSRDAGRSWSWWARGIGEMGFALAQGPTGRWWWAHGLGLWTSPSLGAPWESATDAVCTQLFADPSEPDTVWGCTLGAVLRVRRRVQ